MAETVSIKFLKWNPIYEEERPFQIFTALRPDSKDRRTTNLEWDERAITVQDCRGMNDLHLDTHGFMSFHLPGFDELPGEEFIRNQYVPAVKEMLKSHLEGVGTVFVFDWRVRYSKFDNNVAEINFSDQMTPLLPSNFAHIDTCPISVVQRIQSSFPEDADRILRQRVRAVNVWKPLDYPVEEWGLAVCDGTTVDPDDLVETDSVRKGSVTANYYVKHNEKQKWYFLPRQEPHEALVFKHFDSDPTVPASYALHSSIKQQIPGNMAPRPRKSIEVRALLFSEAIN
ncbi:hypothetical protein HIM_04191 [Hirsutella minnesotensis 3608]|uniref:Methyltransferase CmcJ n=1 Tax=Hirsutella minnesotensis 3608 TaxID=1043627 RepID=A0A0F8A1R9_9HYPO|nr:hypothetical protein HIM_04191 [Hirsutella minnesotensis 3608]